ncbi:LOW QUALITY PROTEIN: mediator of DNA damage checkpoint protein 1 [Elephas maximus indicus]|uniref:LOW QUALITY PROTEIN: mediator of DNA damage checkpoint protein 1 n=1 Tax=Elephas maximus indicus TaxID=99487 RepID=UPI002115EF80|nr:LOW QUALITY PROTEIN: mediator of DNA damage checkpoint protein 1 [Elephas maximus indicus]
MEDTQVIDWEAEEEEETERSSESVGSNLEPLGRLHIFSSAHGPEKDFPLYLGENVVGRMPDCSVALPFPSISKQHAVIEILAWDKAPILRDCGSLNGTQILRPPKVLSPGVSHRLRDQELILFADLPCQYHRRLDVPLPFASRGPLAIEGTPRAQGGTRTQGLLLAEDSDDEIDPLSESCVVKGSRTTSSPLATVVPESDEEGASSARDGPGAPFGFNLNSDTEEEEGQQPASREASSGARKGAPAESKQPDVDGVAAELQLEKDQPSAKERDSDTKVERGAGNVVVPVRVILERSHPAGEDSDTDVDEDSRPPGRPPEGHLERGQPSSFIDSDTDVEEEGIPATPPVVPMKNKQVFRGVGMHGPGVPALAHLQKSQAGGDTGVEQGEASQGSMVINSDTDDEEEVLAALTLARLKESRAVTNHRDTDVEEDRAPPVVLLERSLTSAERDSDTDMEEERCPVESRQTVPRGHIDKDGALVMAHSGKSHPLLRDGDKDVGEEKGSPGAHLERSQASATMDINTESEEKVPLEPAVTHLEKHQIQGTNQTDMKAERSSAKLPVVHLEEAPPPPDEDCETDEEEDMSFVTSALADVRKSQLPAEGDAGTERATAVLKRERALEAGTQGRSPVAQVKQGLLPVSRENLTDLVVDTGTPGDPIQPHRKGAQTLTEREREPLTDSTKDSKDSHDDSEDLDLQATQCFVERENPSLEAIKRMEEEATQAFLFTLPQEEPGPFHCSFQTPGTLDEPWEVLATQPFYSRESEASETQHIAAHLEAHGTCPSRPSPPRATPQDQHPESTVHTESLGIQGRGIQTEEKGLDTPRETAESVTPEREPLEREAKELPPEGEREDGLGKEELTRGLQDREQEQVLARDLQRQESDIKMKSANAEWDVKSLKVEMETSKEIQEKEIEKQALAREIFEREAQRPVPEKESEPAELEVKVPKEVLEETGTQRGETKGSGSQNQKGEASLPTPEPGVGAGALQGLASAPIAPGSQSGRGRVAPVSPTRQRRGRLNWKMPPAEKTSRGGQESPDAFLPPSVPEASATFQNLPISQSQKHPILQPLLSPSLPSSATPIPRTRQKESPEAVETPLSSELEPLYPKPKVRPRGSSRVTPSPVSSTALEPHPPTPTDQPVSTEPTPWVTQGKTRRSSVKIPEPVEPTAPELQPSTSTDQPVTLNPLSRATRGRTHRSSVRTPEPVEPTAPKLQPSTSTDQPVTLNPLSRATRGRTHRSSVKTSEPVEPTASEVQPSTSTDQPVTAQPISQATRGRTRRSSVRTPGRVEHTASELQSSTFTDQPVTSKPTRGRTPRSSVKTPKPIVATAPKLQSSTSTHQPVTPKPISRATRGRTNRSSVKTPEPIEPTAPDLKLPTPTDQSVTSEPILWATQGRTHRFSVKTPEPFELTALELQPSTSKDQFVTPKSTSRSNQDKTHRFSLKTPEPFVPISPDLKPLNPTDQPVTPEPILRTTRSRTHRSSVKTPELGEPTALECQPSTSKDHPVTPEPVLQPTRGRTPRSSVKTPEPVELRVPGLKPPTPREQDVTPDPLVQGSQSKTLKSSTVSAVPVPVTSEFQPPVPTDQPIPAEPIPQPSCNRRQRATRKHESLTAPIVHEPCCTPHEPKSQSSRTQRRGALRAAESLRAIPEPSCPQLEAPTHAPQFQKVEAAGRSGFTPEPQPKASQSRKRTLATMDSPPPQKQPQRREVPQKTELPKEEQEGTAERPGKKKNIVIPGPVKRKRDQKEEEPRGTQSRNLRRTKSNQESVAPKVLFTGVVDARGERAVLALGGSLANSVTEASHLVTDRIRRTVKFLCALGRGIPILSLDWLHQSRKAGCFLPPDEYVVTDPEQEKNFGFSLRDALSRAQKRRLLEGYEIHVTPGVQPPPPQMGEIISCCGGTVLPNMPRSYKPQRVVITCSQDFARCSIPCRIGLPLLSPEFLLTGVLKQEANPEAFTLSTSEMSST